MEEYMNYQWYPGHMTKAVRMMKEDIKLIDLVIEMLDARIPISSRNPDIDQLAAGKARMILLNKSDLASPSMNQEWIHYFKAQGIAAIEMNAKNGNGIKKIQEMIAIACSEKMERDRKRGILNRPIRAMVAGIPNVGKSTFINAYAKRNCTKTGNKPGVTKGKQWIRLGKGLELLDTPGILWPKFEDQATGMKLAFIGSMNDEILYPEEVAADLVQYIQKNCHAFILSEYGVEEDVNVYDAIEQIAIKRGCLKKEGIPDIQKASGMILDDFRSGKLGKYSLEIPNS